MTSVTFSSRIASDLLSHVESLGFDTTDMMTILDLPDGLLHREDIRIPAHKMSRLWSAAIDLTADPFIVFHMCVAQNVSSLQTTSMIMQSSETLEHALQSGISYSSLIANALEMQMGNDGGSIYIDYSPSPSWSIEPKEVVNDSLCSAMVSMLYTTRRLVAIDAAPSVLCFTFAEPDNADELAEVFDCSIRYERRSNRIGFPLQLAKESVPTRDPSLLRALKEYADNIRASMEDRHRHSSRALAEIAKAMDPKPPSLAQVAQTLFMSPRTLQRKIREERSCSFRDLVDEVRMKVCDKLLQDTNRTVEEIGYLAGYADTASFIRAYRRWHGKTPRQTSAI